MSVSESNSELSDKEPELYVSQKSEEYYLKQEKDAEKTQHTQTSAENGTNQREKPQEQGEHAPSNGCQGISPASKKAPKNVRPKSRRRKRRNGDRKDYATTQGGAKEEEVNIRNEALVSWSLREGAAPSGDMNLVPEKLEDRSGEDLTAGKVYVEEGHHFRLLDDSTQSTSLVQQKGESSPLEAAITVQATFARIATFCQGLLAGVTLWQCLVYTQHPEQSAELESVYNAVVHLLALLCLIHALDSADLTQWGWRRCHLPPMSTLAFLITQVAVLLLHLVASTEIPLTKVMHRPWPNIVTGIGALIGWSLTAFSSHKPSMLKHLQAAYC